MAVQQRERSRVEEFKRKLELAKAWREREEARKRLIARRLTEAVYKARLGYLADTLGECRPKKYGYLCTMRVGRLSWGLDTYNWYVDIAYNGKYVGYVGDGHANVKDYDLAERLAQLLEQLPDEYYQLAEMIVEARFADRQLAKEIAEEMLRILEGVA